jgi:hypothetical protein
MATSAYRSCSSTQSSPVHIAWNRLHEHECAIKQACDGMHQGMAGQHVLTGESN